ncbi:PatA/PatG family cyanobactin maturation protease [Anabaena azotica]|uniref:PatA/PatG family cyanobactin maturation protease n=1 Tax=Anabaena azotica FACHB-119 TaxID=947527 RepID=A0ABR8DBV4_9NOST|nr:PatA/PatG family cyanobactin maturation protease [Anabaena azotica]MBD2504677.1 PatA/PatG family cyanobactin maturation protease [Anabaena azotica FACHB-119]
MLSSENLEVKKLAIATSMVEAPELNLLEPDWNQVAVSLSRFAYQRQHEGVMILESPLSKFRVTLLNWQASALIACLAQPQPVAALNIFPDLSPEIIQQFVHLLWTTNFLTISPESLLLQLWDFHNLLFHSRSRLGRHDYPTDGIEQFIDKLPQFPVVKPPMSDKIVPLPRPNLEIVMQRDRTLTEAIEMRQSVREYDETHPITLEQLSELLYRSARIKDTYTLDEKFDEVEFNLGELSLRPYPSGGGMYELEIYPIVRHCEGLEIGLYHYDPLNHQLEQLIDHSGDKLALITDAHQASGEQGIPQVLLVITARFGRLFWKYRSLAYALVLKHVGVLYQNLYLVATNMRLAPCGLGAGNSERFAQVTGLDYIEESSVGEFILGSLPRQDALNAITTSELTDTVFAPAMIVRPATMSSSAAVTSSQKTPTALHPHDLDERIPGLTNLRNQTLGDPRITIVILDGNPDHELVCFQGGNISKVFPYWHQTPEPISPTAYATYRNINNSDFKTEEKEEKLKATFPEAILNRIPGDHHATHITSTIAGQENTPSPGIAPNCRVINIPLSTTGDNDEFISILNLTRAFELALELGANIIHCAACRPTQTGEVQDLLARAVKKCQDNNILIVAPAGNNKGECWCIPAVLPGTLAVGAIKDEGKPFKFSNWGGNYQIEGIMAPGENILGAQPGTEEPKRNKGTSCAAPVMTGICALLMSLQLQQGQPIDAEAIRTALLNTAIPCNPEEVEEPERCLRGFVNLPGVINLLFGQASETISLASGCITQVENVGNRVGLFSESFQPQHFSAEEVMAQSFTVTPSTASMIPASPFTLTGVTPSRDHSDHVYALGSLGYDFGSEARRDSFKQLMPPVDDGRGILVPANPYDIRQIVNYLDRNPNEGRSLIWTLNMEQRPIYALEPKEPFAAEIYEMLLLMLNGQIEPLDSDEFVERVSIPAQRTNRTVELFSGQVVPIITITNVRGMYGWKVNSLVNAALAIVTELTGEIEENMRRSLTNFLNRVYYDLHNLGQTSRDRALNFAATNIFQAVSSFAKAISSGRQLDSLKVEKSVFCRLNSDCWDVKLKFFDPENSHRAYKVFLFTIDVSDRIPVTLGSVKSWSVPK